MSDVLINLHITGPTWLWVLLGAVFIFLGLASTINAAVTVAHFLVSRKIK